jgi:F-type H+-transporting ATPase subunit epsilon
MAGLHFELVTPEKLVLSEDVHMVVVPGTEGESIKDDAELAVYRVAGGPPEKIRVSGGFAEVGDNGLTVLAESAGEPA